MTKVKTAANKLTITRKMSNTGSIHDLASDRFDRTITFAPGCKYAVVLAAYYGGRGYTTHKTAEAAGAAYRKAKRADYSCAVLDVDGDEYDPNYGQFVKL